MADEAQRQLERLAPTGLRAAAFAPNGGWVLVGCSTVAARGIADACFVHLRGCVVAEQAIHSVAFPPAGRGDGGVERWVVVTDCGYRAVGIPDDCFAALAQGWAHGLRPSCIAFPQGVASAPDADGRRAVDDAPRPWVMLAGRTVLGRGIEAACWQRLNNLAQGLRPARQVAFAPGGGWAILSDDGATTQGLTALCHAHIGQVAQAHLVERLAFASDGGWLGSATPAVVLPVDPLRAFEARFRRVAGRWCSLDERMAARRVAGLSVAVALDGRLAWATRYGSQSRHDRIDAERGLSMRDALLAHAVDDFANDFADTCCRLRRYPADRAACAVLVDGGDAAQRAALAEEVVDALVRIHGWRRPPARRPG